MALMLHLLLSQASVDTTDPPATWVSAPLRQIPLGPGAPPAPPSDLAVASEVTPHYLSLALRLPNAATSAQRSRGQRGVSIDLILDTGATGLNLEMDDRPPKV